MSFTSIDGPLRESGLVAEFRRPAKRVSSSPSFWTSAIPTGWSFHSRSLPFRVPVSSTPSVPPDQWQWTTLAPLPVSDEKGRWLAAAAIDPGKWLTLLNVQLPDGLSIQTITFSESKKIPARVETWYTVNFPHEIDDAAFNTFSEVDTFPVTVTILT